MIFNNKKLSQITDDEIIDLVTCNASEDRHLDFKADFSSTNDKSRFEYLKDITAFANTEGGYIIYGIGENSENKDKAGKFTSIDKYHNVIQTCENWNAKYLRAIASYIEIQHRRINEKDIIIIKVPAIKCSFNHNEQTHYYKRIGTSNRGMTDLEIKEFHNSNKSNQFIEQMLLLDEKFTKLSLILIVALIIVLILFSLV